MFVAWPSVCLLPATSDGCRELVVRGRRGLVSIAFRNAVLPQRSRAPTSRNRGPAPPACLSSSTYSRECPLEMWAWPVPRGWWGCGSSCATLQGTPLINQNAGHPRLTSCGQRVVSCAPRQKVGLGNLQTSPKASTRPFALTPTISYPTSTGLCPPKTVVTLPQYLSSAFPSTREPPEPSIGGRLKLS